VYATCALTPEENDNVAGRLPEKYGEQCIVDKPDFSEGEASEYGRIMLPDQCGSGPLYVARFKKHQ
jgi:16S rRNA (cytosine1407-C5)-methyltransferase